MTKTDTHSKQALLELIGRIEGAFDSRHELTNERGVVGTRARSMDGTVIANEDGDAGSNTSDVDILNYALTLEHLEYAFYDEFLTNHSESDVENSEVARYFHRPTLRYSVYQQIEDVRDHEQAHVEKLMETIEGLGGIPVEPAEYEFPYANVTEFVAIADRLEAVGVSAYAGAAPLLSDPDLLPPALSIHSVEADHQTYFQLLHLQRPSPKAFNPARTTDQFLPIAGKFIVGTATDVTVTDPVTIESFDGTTIVTTLFEPATDESRPAVLSTHGWGGTRADQRPLAEFYADNGYVVLTYDSRGFGESGGTVDTDGPKEVKDVSALLDWLADRDSVLNDGPNDPRVGMDGTSYGGGIQLNAAAEEDRLDALIPRWAWHDLRYSLDPNNVLKWDWAKGLYQSGVANGTLDPKLKRLYGRSLAEKEVPDELRSYWKARSPIDDLNRIDTPTLLISGWHDRLFNPNEAFANYRSLRDGGTDARLLMYDGGHNYGKVPITKTQEQYLKETTLAWFRRHLDGADAEVPSRVTLYDPVSDSFESNDELPEPQRTVDLSDVTKRGAIHLSAEENTAFDLGLSAGERVVGAPSLSLSVTPNDGPSHVFAALRDVAPDGTKRTVAGQVAAGLVADSGEFSLDLIGVDYTVEKGHSLELVVGTDDDALLGPLPFGQGQYLDPDDGGVVLHTSNGNGGTLTLPAESADSKQSMGAFVPSFQ